MHNTRDISTHGFQYALEDSSLAIGASASKDLDFFVHADIFGILSHGILAPAFGLISHIKDVPGGRISHLGPREHCETKYPHFPLFTFDDCLTGATLFVGNQEATWLSDVYDSLDYVDALRRADECAGSIPFDETADEFIYGEFDMAFFLGLLQRYMKDSEPGSASFVDVGSGRGQLVHLAALTWKWKRCVGVELVPILHELACAANSRISDQRGVDLR